MSFLSISSLSQTAASCITSVTQKSIAPRSEDYSSKVASTQLASYDTSQLDQISIPLKKRKVILLDLNIAVESLLKMKRAREEI